MSELINQNDQRRQAQRQKRGVLRVEEILQAANELFAERGYDNVTMHMLAVHAHTSPGSLYQFFPNKEAVARELAMLVAQELQQLYDTFMVSDVLELPFTDFLERFIDRLVALNRTFPGYFALEVGATLSPSLTLVLRDLQHGLQLRLDALIGSYWIHSNPEQRHLPLLVSYRVFLALLPLTLHNNDQQVVQEIKKLLLGYWIPLLSEGGGDLVSPHHETRSIPDNSCLS